MPNPVTQMFCPLCDRQESGRTESRLLNNQGGWSCQRGHKFANYIQLMNLNPRKEKLRIVEKQPAGSTVHSFWVHPEALAALEKRFPTNFRTTIYSLFNALADPDTILIEGEHCRELRALGVTRGRDIVGLARTNISLDAELKALQDQMKQYEMISRLLAVASGGQANSLGAQAAALAPLVAGAGSAAAAGAEATSLPSEKPPQQPVAPVILTEADQIWEPTPVDVAPGRFSDGSFSEDLFAPLAPPGSGNLSRLLRNLNPPG